MKRKAIDLVLAGIDWAPLFLPLLLLLALAAGEPPRFVVTF